jgi:hypothetical protein
MKVTSKDKEGLDVTLYVRKPNARDNQEAKLYANSIASQILLRKDEHGKPAFITRQQVRQILRDSGRLSDKQEEEIRVLGEKIKGLEDILTKGGIKKSEGRKIALELKDTRTLLFIALMAINELDEHTLENEVENANFDFLVSRCATSEDGKSVFKDVDDYRGKAEDEPYAYEAANALKVLLYGTTEDMLRDNIENKFLAKFKYIDEKLRLINADGHLVDRLGNLIDEEGNLVDKDNKPIVEERKTDVGDFLDDEEEKPATQEVQEAPVSSVEPSQELVEV